MKAQTAKQPRCPVCRSVELEAIKYERKFQPRNKKVVVTLQSSRCKSCGAEFTTAAQHDENLSRLRARKQHYDGLLLGEEILALRRRYGITQQQAGKIFGKGQIAFSRYENESSYPDASTTKLLELAIARPEVIKSLADEEQIELPLWEARCEDALRNRLGVVSVGEADEAAQRWAKQELAQGGKREMTGPRVLFLTTSGLEKRVISHSDDDQYFDGPEAQYA